MKHGTDSIILRHYDHLHLDRGPAGKNETRNVGAMYEEAVRSILAEHSKLSVDLESLQNDSDLYEVGLTSLTTVNVMLAIEDHFDVEFDDSMLARATFQSVGTLVDAVAELLER